MAGLRSGCECFPVTAHCWLSVVRRVIRRLTNLPLDFAFSAIAAQSDDNPARWRRPFIRWTEGVEAGWSIPLLIVCFIAAWTACLSIAYMGSGLHPDFLETWTLGQRFAWSNPKHSPLMGWVTGAWTSIFPSVDWSLHLMAMTNAALALWAVDLISKSFVTGHKRLLGPALADAYARVPSFTPNASTPRRCVAGGMATCHLLLSACL